MSENLEVMKRCLAHQSIRVTTPSGCGRPHNRFSQDNLEGSGCEKRRYNNVDADSDAADSGGDGDADSGGDGGGGGSSPLIFVHQ